MHLIKIHDSLDNFPVAYYLDDDVEIISVTDKDGNEVPFEKVE